MEKKSIIDYVSSIPPSVDFITREDKTTFPFLKEIGLIEK